MLAKQKKAAFRVVRDYTAADREEILALWSTVFWQSFSYLEDSPTEEDFRLHFENVVTRQHRIWVAIDGNAIVGFITATGDSVCNLFVDQRHQRRGIGTALLQTALHHNPTIHSISTLEANTPARRFYEKNGFIFQGTESHTFPGHQTFIYRRAGVKG